MGDINLLARIERLAKKIGSAITTSDKASKSKFGIVKIGNGINVNSGVISVSASGGSVSLTEIASNFGSFTFPTGKTIADYSMLVIVGARSGYTDVMTTICIPTAILSSTQIAFPLWFNGNLANEIYVTNSATADKTSGQMVVSKVYAF